MTSNDGDIPSVSTSPPSSDSHDSKRRQQAALVVKYLFEFSPSAVSHSGERSKKLRRASRFELPADIWKGQQDAAPPTGGSRLKKSPQSPSIASEYKRSSPGKIAKASPGKSPIKESPRLSSKGEDVKADPDLTLDKFESVTSPEQTFSTSHRHQRRRCVPVPGQPTNKPPSKRKLVFDDNDDQSDAEASSSIDSGRAESDGASTIAWTPFSAGEQTDVTSTWFRLPAKDIDAIINKSCMSSKKPRHDPNVADKQVHFCDVGFGEVKEENEEEDRATPPKDQEKERVKSGLASIITSLSAVNLRRSY